MSILRKYPIANLVGFCPTIEGFIATINWNLEYRRTFMVLLLFLWSLGRKRNNGRIFWPHKRKVFVKNFRKYYGRMFLKVSVIWFQSDQIKSSVKYFFFNLNKLGSDRLFIWPLKKKKIFFKIFLVLVGNKFESSEQKVLVVIIVHNGAKVGIQILRLDTKTKMKMIDHSIQFASWTNEQ